MNDCKFFRKYRTQIEDFIKSLIEIDANSEQETLQKLDLRVSGVVVNLLCACCMSLFCTKYTLNRYNICTTLNCFYRKC